MPTPCAPPPTAPLLDSAQFAALLWPSDTTPVAQRKLHKAVCRGHVPRGARLPGLGLRWRRDEVDAWIARQFRDRAPGA